MMLVTELARGNRHRSRLEKPGVPSENRVWEKRAPAHAAPWSDRAKSQESTRESDLSLVEKAADRVLEGEPHGDLDLWLG
jgi:hypothetical protein